MLYQMSCYGPCFSSFYFFCVVYYVCFSSEFRVVMSVTMSAYKLCSVHHYLQLFIGRLMSYLRILCMLAYTQWCPTHIVLCYCLACLRLVYPCCQFLWIVHFWLPLRYSVTFTCLIGIMYDLCWNIFCRHFEWTILTFNIGLSPLSTTCSTNFIFFCISWLFMQDLWIKYFISLTINLTLLHWNMQFFNIYSPFN
jgi:hypothetical protein